MTKINLDNTIPNSSLASGITDSATSLTLATGDGANYANTPLMIGINAEALLVTNRSGDVLTVTRAQQGTAATAHSADDVVKHIHVARNLLPIDDTTGNYLLEDDLDPNGNIILASSSGITYRGGDGSTGGTHTLTMPGGLTSGDLLVAIGATRNTVGTAPTGFTTLWAYDLATDEYVYGYYKVSDGTETSITWTMSAADSAVWIGCFADAAYKAFFFDPFSRTMPIARVAATDYVIQCVMNVYTGTQFGFMDEALFTDDATLLPYEELGNEWDSNQAGILVVGGDAEYAGHCAPLRYRDGSTNLAYIATGAIILEPA